MSKAPGIEQQLKYLSYPLERIYKRRIIAAAPQMADNILDILTTNYDYHDITGNATTGWYVAIYVREELIYFKRSADELEPPTRRTLRKGEMYDLDTYWGGEPVEGKPYVGKQGRANYFAYKRALEFIRNHKVKYARKNRLVVLVGNATEYSSYNPKIANQLTAATAYLSQQGFYYMASGGENIPF